MYLVSGELVKMCAVAMGFIGFDVITGVVGAFATGSFKSAIMRQGGWHKLMLLVALAFGVFLDVAQKMVELGVNIPAGQGICIYIILMEICSNIENINKGFPGAIPEPVLKLFNTAREEYKHE